MTRDGYNGSTAQQVAQTHTFEYDANGDGYLKKTIFPENGTTEYDPTQFPAWKKNSRGIWKYFYTVNKKLQRVEKYPGATNINSLPPEDRKQRVEYYYDSQTLDASFVGQNLAGRLAAVEYNCDTNGWNCTREFYSYTAGGKLKKSGCRSWGYRLLTSASSTTLRASCSTWFTRAEGA
jgi:hypothetical protein